ncbi:MAG TPA: J domain-containing protein [Acidimicrobiales bacterium]|nr:J domain-containing protein [Acidimicrobiales bacterium]
MDARKVLGLGPGATAAEVEGARRRLTRQVGPAGGGTPELARVVAAAARQLADGRPAPAFDPHRLLGIALGASAAEARLAYRRLVLLVHPDRGGTEELFGLVESAYHAVVDPLTRHEATTGAGSYWDPYRVRRRRPRPHYPRPRVPGPWVPPPPERWARPSRWNAVVSVVVNVTVLAMVALPALALSGVALAFAGPFALPVVVGLAMGALLVSRRLARTVLLGLVQLRPVAMAPGSEPERFLGECCLDSPTDRLGEDHLYGAYRAWCRRKELNPVPPWVFAQRLLTLGILRTDASGWEEALWVGLRLRRPDPGQGPEPGQERQSTS